MSDDVIIGAGGGGKSGSGGGGLSEQSDSLKSNSYAQVLDLISEGEIGGLVAGMKSIYLDDTPIQNADGSMNFSGVTYAATTGTQTQGVISGFDQVRNEITVGLEAKISSGPIVRSVTNTNVTSVIVTIQIPSLTFLDSKGNLGGTSVNFAIDVQNNGGGYVEKVNDTITGKTSSAYQRQYRIELPAGGPWDIRLRRITADSSSANLNNKTVLYSYTEIIDAKLSYPNSALVAVKVDASQFRAIPKRGYDVKLLKIRFPTNATVRADGSLAYAGSWDGTFQVGWCACPAWAYYDLLTTDRYGLGNYIDPTQVDKWSLYTISKYCNELVSNGFGGTEPRFTCNVWINTRQEAFKLISDLTSCFRGMTYWSSGAVTTVQDAPTDPAYLFTNANVIDGMFAYQGSSAKSRHTVALVTWNDPADLYRQKVEYVEDATGIARYGVIEASVVAFGCSSRGQANRVGRWLLYSERQETEVVTFKTGGEAAYCRPGDIIKVTDQHRAGARYGGRVKSATSTTLTVDKLDTVPAAGSTLYVIGTDGVVQTRTVSSVAGLVVTVSAAFSPVPVAQSVWSISTSTVAAQTFRVLAVSEADNGEHEINALEHDPGKFALIENGLTLEPRSYSTLAAAPATPTGLTLSELTYSFSNTTRRKIACKWNAATGAARYRVEWRANSGNWKSDTTTAAFYEIFDAELGPHDVRVIAINSLELPSTSSATASITVVGNGWDVLVFGGVALDDAMLARNNVTVGGGLPSIASSNVGDTHVADDGTFYERVNEGGILLDGKAIVLGGYRPRIGWTKSASQPLVGAIAASAAADAAASYAITHIDNLADDGVLTINEKVVSLIPENSRLEGAWSAISAAAATAGVSTTTATTKRAAWIALRDGLSPAWNDISADTVVTRATYRAALVDYDQALEDLNKAVIEGMTAAKQVTVAPPAAATVYCDYTGAAKTGQLAKVLTPSVTRGGTDIRTASDVTYSISAPSQVAATVNNTSGSADKGRITIGTGFTGPGTVQLTVTVAGIAYGPFPVLIDRQLDSPPNTGGGGGSGPAYDYTFNAVSLNSFTAISDELGPLTLAAGQKLVVTAPLDYEYQNTTTTGRYLTAKAQYWDGSAWQDFPSSPVNGSVASWNQSDLSGSSGSINLSQEKTGLGAGTYKVRLVAALSAAGGTITVSSGVMTFSIV